MSNIAAELAKLHVLKGADYSRQVERIARMGNFHPIDNEFNIFSTGGESGIFKGRKSISVSRDLSLSKSFYGLFMKKYFK